MGMIAAAGRDSTAERLPRLYATVQRVEVQYQAPGCQMMSGKRAAGSCRAKHVQAAGVHMCHSTRRHTAVPDKKAW